ncbi:MAG: hypothetical protein KTV77_04370 [Wolbachia endosymbiont of Fragariocoptes setiger]|nr:hypothetical protein [Wolbachia endosymbiont of Fragariocoptes setiger]
MSSSLVINIAFFTGAILSYKLAEKVIKNLIKKKRKRKNSLNSEDEEFRKEVLNLYSNAVDEYRNLDGKVKKLFNDVCKQANDIIDNSKKILDKELKDNTDTVMKQSSNKIKKAINDLNKYTTNIASKVTEKIINEYQDDKVNSKVISSLSRDLNKKLH